MDQEFIKIQEYLEKLSSKIPNIKAGLKLTNELSEYVEHRSYGKITSPNYYVLNNYKKITLSDEEWRKFEIHLILKVILI